MEQTTNTEESALELRIRTLRDQLQDPDMEDQRMLLENVIRRSMASIQSFEDQGFNDSVRL